MTSPNDLGFRAQPDTPLTVAETQHALAALLADPEQFARARDLLKPAAFAAAHEVAYRAVWSAALERYRTGGHETLFGVPAPIVRHEIASLAMSVAERERLTPDLVALHGVLAAENPPDRPSLTQWLYWPGWPGLYRTPYCRDMVTKLLRQRALSWTAAEAVAAAGGRPLANVGDLAERLKQIQVAIDSAGRPRATYGDTAAPDGAAVPEPTQVAYVDELTDGGLRAGNLYLLSGCIGAGKTTLGASVAVAVAARETFLARGGDKATAHLESVFGPGAAAGYVPRTVYYFHWEMTAQELRDKFQSCAALVDFRRLERRGNARHGLAAAAAELPGGPRAAHYAKLCAEQYQGLAVPAGLSEQARYEAGCRILGERLVGVDYSGGDPRYAAAGAHFVDGVVAYLDLEAQVGNRPALVVLDYVQAMATAAVAARPAAGKEKDLTYHLLYTAGHQLVTRVAQRFRCPVLVLSQFNTEANKRSPALPRHHSEASHCGALGSAAAACLNLGTPDRTHNVRLLNDSKGRFTPLGAYRIMTIAGPTNRFLDVTKDYEVVGSGFYKKGDAQPDTPAGPASGDPAGGPVAPAAPPDPYT